MDLRFGMLLTMYQSAHLKEGVEARSPGDWFKPPEPDYEMTPEQSVEFLRNAMSPQRAMSKALANAKKEPILR